MLRYGLQLRGRGAFCTCCHSLLRGHNHAEQRENNKRFGRGDPEAGHSSADLGDDSSRLRDDLFRGEWTVDSINNLSRILNFLDQSVIAGTAIAFALLNDDFTRLPRLIKETAI